MLSKLAGLVRKLQRVIVALVWRSEEAENRRDLRRTTAMLAWTLRASPSRRRERLDGLRAVAAAHAAEVATWVGPDALVRGEGGPFDACDLRCWLALAARAELPAIPAREILRLSEDEMSRVSGLVVARDDAPAFEPTERQREAMTEVADAVRDVVGTTREVDAEALAERLASAMDDVPEGWMVRSARCGSSTLKALSGAGIAGPVVPEVRFGPDDEVGPGWRRVRNRRSVEAGDRRTVESYAHGPGGDLAFLARPWARPARLLCCEDPHRSGTPLAGPGWWPVELRAFVVRGRVEGVSSYFSWIPFEPTPENARTMLVARHLAQRLADECVRQRALPRYLDVELSRDATFRGADAPERLALLEEFGRDEVAFTVDLLEVGDEAGRGLTILEAGPAASPWGGGHPCGFAGVGGPPRIGTRPGTRGAAFQSMAHVVIGDPRTWTPGDVAGRILSWEEVEELARREDPPVPLAATGD